MLSALYSLVLGLRRRSFPPSTAEEMKVVFAAAREDAWRRGPGAYLRFAVRELGGLIGSNGSRDTPGGAHRPLRWVVAGALIGACLAFAALLVTPPRYRSEARLRVAHGVLPERYVASPGGLDLEHLLRNQLATVLSRHSLTNIMRTYNLYPKEEERLPLEQLVERMRQEIRIQFNPDGTCLISFTHSTPHGAQKVTLDIMQRLIDHAMREQSMRRNLIAQFLFDRSEAAAKAWIEQEARLRNLKPEDPALTRTQLDAELAKREYVALREKLSEARMAQAAATSKFDAVPEVLDIPSLPARTNRDGLLLTLLGTAAGGLLGLLFGWMRSVRPVDMLASSPTSA